MNYDAAILIGEQLMRNDSVLASTDLQEEVLEVLLNACRLRKDNEAALYWATELGNLYHNLGKDTEALRTDAEIGSLLIRIGQKEEGLAKIDSVIGQLDGQRKFNELDASIIALKRKAEICSEKGLYGDVISAAHHILDLLATPSYTFEARTDDYASRFKLVFATGDAGADDPFAFISNGNLIVNGEGTLQVIDMLGHILLNREAHSDSCLLPSDFLPSGVYVLRLINGNDVKTQKMVIE